MMEKPKTPLTLVLFALPALSACSMSEDDGELAGYVEAEYVYVAAPQSGWLRETTVIEGKAVARGETLFELEKGLQEAQLADANARTAQAKAQLRDMQTGARPAEIAALEAQLREAEARRVQARAERDRWMPLVAEGNATKARGDQVQAEYRSAVARVEAAEEAIEVAKLEGRTATQEAAEAAVVAAEASMAQAQWHIDERTVNAPLAGTIEDVFHRKGEFVAAGAPVLAILPADAMKVRFFVPQARLTEVSLGSPVNVESDGSEMPIEATVSYIAQEAEFTPPVIYSADSRGKLVFLVEARLPAGSNLRPGLPVDVSLP